METEEWFQRRGSNGATSVLDCSKASLNSREALSFRSLFTPSSFLDSLSMDVRLNLDND